MANKRSTIKKMQEWMNLSNDSRLAYKEAELASRRALMEATQRPLAPLAPLTSSVDYFNVWNSPSALDPRLFYMEEQAIPQPKKLSKAEQAKLIQQIHDDFNSEVDNLLQSASVELSLDTQLQSLIDKVARLKSLGFTQTKEVVAAKAEIERLEGVKKQIEANTKLRTAINYFSHKYPQYKFITTESVNKICNKYGLVFGDVAKYRGEVPDKNLAEIENAKNKIDERDECIVAPYITYGRNSYVVDFKQADENGKYPTGLLHESHRQAELWKGFSESLGLPSNKPCTMKMPLQIAAPKSDFDTRNMTLTGNQLTPMVDNDPVVLKPVQHEGERYFLILSCWGLESTDELVQNENNN